MGPTRPTHGFDISRADFWGWGEFAPTDQRVIRNRDVQLVKATGTTAELAIQNDWTIRGNRYVDEQTTAVWRARDGANILDLTYGADAGLGHDAEPDAVRRLLRPRAQRRRVLVRGAVREDHPSGSPLLGGGSELAGARTGTPTAITLSSGKTIGCAVVDHPSNPPATWHNPRYVWMVNPCIVAAKPVTVASGRPLTLRYRVIVFDGRDPGAARA